MLWAVRHWRILIGPVFGNSIAQASTPKPTTLPGYILLPRH
jgi:hypothetical protein